MAESHPGERTWANIVGVEFCDRTVEFCDGARERHLQNIKVLDKLSRGVLRLFLLIVLQIAFLVAPVATLHVDNRRESRLCPIVMGTVHRLIHERGKQGALEVGEFDRRELEAAAAYMADEDNSIGYLYSGWCQAALPHRRLPDSKGWQVQSGPVTLIVEPGMRPGLASEPVPVGVPYGSRARLILIYLQSEAIRTKSREIELGRSLRIWLGRLGISIGGLSVSAVRDQAERISRCHMTFQITKGRGTGLLKQSIVDSAMFLDDPEDRGSRNQGPSEQFSGSRYLRLACIPAAQPFWPYVDSLASADDAVWRRLRPSETLQAKVLVEPTIGASRLSRRTPRK